MNRQEHLQWCKGRALEYVDNGDLPNAFASFASLASDLNTHPETEGHCAITLGMGLLMGNHLDTAEKMINFIEDFN